MLISLAHSLLNRANATRHSKHKPSVMLQPRSDRLQLSTVTPHNGKQGEQTGFLSCLRSVRQFVLTVAPTPAPPRCWRATELLTWRHVSQQPKPQQRLKQHQLRPLQPGLGQGQAQQQTQALTLAQLLQQRQVTLRRPRLNLTTRVPTLTRQRLQQMPQVRLLRKTEVIRRPQKQQQKDKSRVCSFQQVASTIAGGSEFGANCPSRLSLLRKRARPFYRIWVLEYRLPMLELHHHGLLQR